MPKNFLQLKFVGAFGHAFNAKFHQRAEFKSQIVCAALNDFAITFRGKTFVLEFFLETFNGHARHFFGTHERVSVNNAREFVDGEQTFLAIGFGFNRRARQAVAVRNYRGDVVFASAFRAQEVRGRVDNVRREIFQNPRREGSR